MVAPSSAECTLRTCAQPAMAHGLDRVRRKRQLLLAENILDTYATLKAEK